MSEDKPYFKNLDSTRFFAALTAYLLHGFSPMLSNAHKRIKPLEKFFHDQCWNWRFHL